MTEKMNQFTGIALLDEISRTVARGEEYALMVGEWLLLAAQNPEEWGNKEQMLQRVEFAIMQGKALGKVGAKAHADQLLASMQAVVDAGYDLTVWATPADANQTAVYSATLLKQGAFHGGTSSREFARALQQLVNTYAPSRFAAKDASERGEWLSTTLNTPEHDTLDVYDAPLEPIRDEEVQPVDVAGETHWVTVGDASFPAPEEIAPGEPMWKVFNDRMSQDGICTEAPSLDDLPQLFPPTTE